MLELNRLSGATVYWRDNMATLTTAFTAAKSELLPIVMAALIGMAIVVITGHVQASAIHDAAHDVRHATGFPCH